MRPRSESRYNPGVPLHEFKRKTMRELLDEINARGDSGARRVPRYDYAVARVDFDATEVAPGIAPAQKTDEGYLLVQAFIARDGLLEYSDGDETWIEYRPRAELEAAAATWASTPFTSDHPEQMVDATNWSEVARGIHLGAPEITPPIDGTSYLLADLLITDADTIAEMEGGKRELSIGFTSEVLPVQDGRAQDGTQCDAVQTGLIGNHTASVEQGRAGPACRAFLDSAAWTVQNAEDLMKPTKPPVPKPVVKADQVGAPTESVEYPMPDGTTIQLPTTVVAMLEELMALRAQAGPVTAATEAEGQVQTAPPPVAPAPAVPQAPAAVAPPTLPGQDLQHPPNEEEEDKGRRESAHFPFDVAAAKAVIAKRMPWAKTEHLDSVGIGTLFAAALQMPDASATPAPRVDDGTNPFQQPAEISNSVEDAHDVKVAAYLRAQGYN